MTVKRAEDLEKLDHDVFQVSGLTVTNLTKYYPSGYGFLVCVFDPKRGVAPHPFGVVHSLPNKKLWVPLRQAQKASSIADEKIKWDHTVYSVNTKKGDGADPKPKNYAGLTAEEITEEPKDYLPRGKNIEDFKVEPATKKSGDINWKLLPELVTLKSFRKVHFNQDLENFELHLDVLPPSRSRSSSRSPRRGSKRSTSRRGRSGSSSSRSPRRRRGGSNSSYSRSPRRGGRSPRRGSRSPRRRTPSPLGNKLYVGNLPFNVTEQELEKTFGKHGKVVKASLVRDNQDMSRGFAFVEFEKKEEAAEAIKDLNGCTYGERIMQVNLARERGSWPSRGGGYSRGYSRGGPPRYSRGYRSPPRRYRSPPRRYRSRSPLPRRRRDSWSPPRRRGSRSPPRRRGDSRSPPPSRKRSRSPPSKRRDSRSPSKDSRSPPRKRRDSKSPERR